MLIVNFVVILVRVSENTHDLATKLSACVKHFNESDLAYVIHLGDFIDRDYESFEVVKPIYDSLIMPRYHVLGNHDFSVDQERKAEIPSLLGIPSRYDYFDLKGWRFIILDGNDLSFHAYPESSEQYEKSSQYYRGTLNHIAQMEWCNRRGATELVKATLSRRRSIAIERDAVLPFSYFSRKCS